MDHERFNVDISPPLIIYQDQMHNLHSKSFGIQNVRYVLERSL